MKPRRPSGYSYQQLAAALTFNTGVNNSATPRAVPFTVLITFCISENPLGSEPSCQSSDYFGIAVHTASYTESHDSPINFRYTTLARSVGLA